MLNHGTKNVARAWIKPPYALVTEFGIVWPTQQNCPFHVECVQAGRVIATVHEIATSLASLSQTKVSKNVFSRKSTAIFVLPFLFTFLRSHGWNRRNCNLQSLNMNVKWLEDVLFPCGLNNLSAWSFTPERLLQGRLCTPFPCKKDACMVR